MIPLRSIIIDETAELFVHLCATGEWIRYNFLHSNDVYRCVMNVCNVLHLTNTVHCFFPTACIQWIRTTFPRNNNGRRRLLVWDSCQVHLTAAVQQKLHRRDTDVAVIPGSLMPLIQPLDVSINRPFKQQMQHMWEHWMINVMRQPRRFLCNGL